MDYVHFLYQETNRRERESQHFLILLAHMCIKNPAWVIIIIFLFFSLSLCRGIGLLSNHIPSSSHSLLSTTILQLLSSNSCIYKIIGSLLITYWTNAPTNPDIVTSLTSSLTEYCVYDEVAPFMTSLQKDCYVCELVLY